MKLRKTIHFYFYFSILAGKKYTHFIVLKRHRLIRPNFVEFNTIERFIVVLILRA